MIAGTAGLAFSAGGAMAQTAPAPAAVQEIVVTGSRIPRPNLTSESAITTVSAQDVKLEGIVNVEDLINNLPQAFGDYGSFESNGSTGTASVNLRGLGSSRTLVLIDGKRLQPGDPTLPVADLNFIPPALIERVDVLTGGASATYGSDAIAGVVNFIMKKNFQGLQIDAQTTVAEDDGHSAQTAAASKFGNTSSSFGFPPVKFPGQKWDGQKHSVTITGGINAPDGKGNLEVYFGYTSLDPVLQANRAYSACSLATNNTNTLQQYCGGSSTDAGGRLTPETNTFLNGTVTKPANRGKSYTILNGVNAPVGSFLPRLSPGDYYNYAPLNYFQRPDTRYTAGEFSNYEVNPHIDIYTSFMFMDDHTAAQIAGSGSFYGANTYTIPCSDPLLTAADAYTLCGPSPAAGETAQALIGKRNLLSPRIDDLEHVDYRIVLGAKGEMIPGWTYDVSTQYGHSALTSIQEGYFLNSKLINALNVVSFGGVATCASVVAGTDKACVPYNIWSPNAVTPAALAYLTGTAIATGSTTEQIVTGSISGDLTQYGIKSPFATKGVGVSFGGEYRREALETFFDSTFQSGDLAGSGGSSLDTSGAQSDRDFFFEVNTPIIEDHPFVKLLSIDGAYRYADYTYGGGNTSYKIGGEWQSTPDIMFRASYEKAARAPNVQELFDPQTPGLVAGADPCAGKMGPNSPTAAQCYNTFAPSNPGISLAQFTSQIYGNITPCVSGQCGTISGGNPALKPEIGETTSYGIVLTPKFIPRLTISVDAFDINLTGAVEVPAFSSILNQCLAGDTTTCGDIKRDANVGYALFGGLGDGGVIQALQNIGSLKTSGFDTEIHYSYRLDNDFIHDMGTLRFDVQGTYVAHLKTAVLDQKYDCAGLYGVTCGTPTPKWRHQFRVSWDTPWNVSLSMNWRFLSATTLDFNSNQTALWQLGHTIDQTPTDARIPDYSYFDISATYRMTDKLTFRAGVNNIMDVTPPLLDSNSFGISAPPFGNGNTYPQVFDPLGRVLFVGLTADF
jgi:outer membrane receptor protein involved in Fe transport